MKSVHVYKNQAEVFVRQCQRQFILAFVVILSAIVVPQSALAQASTSIVMAFSPPSPSTFGTAVTITATVTNIAVGANTAPNGSVQFSDTAQGPLGTANLSATGATTSTASITVSTGATGVQNLFPFTHTITGAYAGNSNFQPSSGNGTYTVTQINTAVNNPFTLTPSPASGVDTPGQSVTFTVNSCMNLALPGCSVGQIPRGSVTLTVAGAYNQSQLLSNGSAVFTIPAGLPAGTQQVFLDYAQTGNSDPWAAAGNVISMNYVVLLSQTINFGPLANQYFGVAPITLTATASSNLPVTFASNTPTVCTVSGTTLTVVGVGAGTCTIVASQAGNSTYAPATNTQSFTVAQDTTSTAISFSPPSPSTFGTAVIITATVTNTAVGSVAAPTGSVQFVDSVQGVLGTANLSTSGPATSSASITVSHGGGTPNLLPSARTITGNYTASTPANVAASSGNGAYTVNQINTLTNSPFNVTANPVSGTAAAGQSVTFSVNSCTNLTLPGCNVGVVPQGSVTLRVGSAYSHTQPLTNGSTVFTISAGLPGGSQQVFLDYSQTSPLDPWATATGVVSTTYLVLSTQTITFGTLANQTYGVAPLTLNATTSSNLPVSFASSTPTICTVSGATLTVVAVGAGTCTIVASQAGNSSYAAATSVPQSFTVAKAALTVTVNNASKVYGAALPAFTATFAGFVNGDTQASAVTGAASLTTAATSTTSPGAYAIVAGAGTLAAANYSFSFVNGTLTISKANTTTSLSVYNSVTGAFVYPVTPGAGTPTGTVQFMNGSTVVATVTLSNGNAVLNNPPTGATLVAVYSGDANFNGSSSNFLSTAGTPVTSAVTLTCSPNPANLGQIVTCTALVTGSGSGSPTGTVQFFDGTKLLATVAVSNGQASYSTTSLTGGPHNIVAVYSGDNTFPQAQATYGLAVFATVTMNVAPKSATIVYGQNLTLTVTVGPSSPPTGFSVPTGQVTFQIGTTVLGTATLASGTASFIVPTMFAGSYTITVTYGGDGTWGSAVATVPVVVGKATSASNLTLALNSSGQVVLTDTVTAVAPGAGTPTGTVQFVDTSNNNNVIATTALGNGTTSTTIAISAAGRPIAAMYVGDANFLGGFSGSLPVAFNGAGIPSAVFAADEVVSVFNVTGLNGDTAATLPLTTTLGGATVKVLDSNGTTRMAPLYGVFASAAQINLVMPDGTATGPALMTIALPGGGTLNTAFTIAATAPGIFTATMNGSGVYAGQVVHVHADGSQTVEPSATYNSSQQTYVPTAINLGPSTDQVFLILYGTGIRGAPNGQVTAIINGITATVYYAGTQVQFPGLDQVNLLVPAGLAGAGTVNIVLTVNGQPANTSTVTFQ